MITQHIAYDVDRECYVWWHNGDSMCLTAVNQTEAEAEVQDYIAHDIYPEAATSDEETFDDDDTTFMVVDSFYRDDEAVGI